jgi:hypothetical protein
MPIDDVALQTLESIEEETSKFIERAGQGDGTEPITPAREGQQPSEGRDSGLAMEELGVYEGDQIDSSVIFAGEGPWMGSRRRKMSPQYAKGLAEAAKFYRAALDGRVSMRQVQEVMMSSEFSTLLGDTLDRVLLAKYATYAPSYRMFLRGRTVRDFRAVGTVRRNTGGRLSAVPEAGDYPQEGLTEESFTYTVGKYGKGYPLTWEMIINDDLDAFTSLPDDMADDAIQTEMYLASSYYVANTTLFATHAVTVGGTSTNYSNKGTAALAYAALKDGINAMLQYPGDQNKPLNNMPIYLVVPPALAIEANRILSTQLLIVAGGDSTTGIGAVAQPARTGIEGMLQVIVDPYIPILDTTNGHNSWYLFSDPRRIHGAEYAFLRGFEQPQVFKRMPNAMRLGGGTVEEDFDNDSVGYKVRHVFGGSHANSTGGWRACYWSDGTA